MRGRKNHRLGKKYLQNTYLIKKKRLTSIIYQELLKPNNKKTSNPIKKWGKDLNTYITRENIYMADKQMKRCSVSNIIRELQAKTKLRSLHTY